MILLPRLKIAIGIATTGRRELLSAVLRELAAQTRLPDCLFICPVDASDFDSTIVSQLPYPTVAVKSSKGLPAQRNAILDSAQEFDVMIFFDDDFVAEQLYLEEIEKSFREYKDVVAMSGQVIADGVTGPGLELGAALSLLKSYLRNPSDARLTEQHNAYGCNMAIRLAPVRAHALRFDENLPLYGWQEDVDFCRQLAPYGRIVKNWNLIGVHLGVKGGRTSGFRFGYSQIANPLYLWRKGTLRLDRASGQIGRNLAANFGHVLRPEPWVDRRGRVRGNLKAFSDLLRGRLDPRRILEFD